MSATCLPYIFERTPYQSTKQEVSYLCNFNYTLLFHLSRTPVARNVPPSPGYITHNFRHPSAGLYSVIYLGNGVILGVTGHSLKVGVYRGFLRWRTWVT